MWKAKKIKQNEASLPRGAVGKEFFLKKIKNRLCRRPLHRTLGTVFFQKNKKTIFADGFCPGPSAQDFFQKK
jgi:hypothetical protein